MYVLRDLRCISTILLSAFVALSCSSEPSDRPFDGGTLVEDGGEAGADASTDASRDVSDDAADVEPAEVSIPLTVQEALPAEVGARHLDLNYVVPPRARAGELVSVGVPLADEARVISADQLGLEGAEAGQFRVLHRYPSGNVQWVLASFLSTLEAGGSDTVTLTGGSGDFGGEPLATETDTHVVIDTGAATFELNKQGFGLLESVTVDGRQMLSDAGELVATDAAGNEYLASRDSSPSITIEDNGPVKSVVRVRGDLVSEAGDPLMGFVARLTFARNSSGVDFDLSLSNDDADRQQTVEFVSLTVKMPLALDSKPHYQFVGRTHDELWTGTLDSGQRAHLFQGFTKYLGTGYVAGENISSYIWPPATFPLPGNDPQDDDNYHYFVDPPFIGLQVEAAGEQLVAGDDLSYTLGYMNLSDDTGNGVSAAYRWMAGYWPASYEVSGSGEVEVGLWSRHQTKPIQVGWGGRMSRQVRLDFHRSEHDPQATLYGLQYPLIAKAPLEHYRNTGAVFGQQELVTVDQEEAYFNSHGYEHPGYENDDFSEVIRRVHWRRNYRYHIRSLWQFMRTGHSSEYMNAYHYARFFADKATAHSEGFSLLDLPDGEASPEAQDPPDFEHQMSKVMPLMYWMSGDEAIREAIGDYGEYLLRDDNGQMPDRFPSFRAWLRNVKNFAWLYEFHRDDAYAEVVRRCADFILDTYESDEGSRGRNLERGYFHWKQRKIHTYFGVEIFGEVSYQMLSLFHDYPEVGYERIEAFEDALLGIAQFIFEEGIWRGEDFAWMIYRYQLDEANPPVDEPYTHYAGSRWLVHLYHQLGEERFFEPYSQVSYGYTGTDGKNRTGMSRRLDQQALFQIEVEGIPPRRGWREVPDLAVEDHGDGSFTLTWTVPDGATAYKIKHADRAIVPWLGFDQSTREYAVDPASHVPWFAATNVADEPAPEGAGSTQTFTLSGLQPGAPRFFTVHYSTAAAGR